MSYHIGRDRREEDRRGTWWASSRWTGCANWCRVCCSLRGSGGVCSVIQGTFPTAGPVMRVYTCGTRTRRTPINNHHDLLSSYYSLLMTYHTCDNQFKDIIIWTTAVFMIDTYRKETISRVDNCDLRYKRDRYFLYEGLHFLAFTTKLKPRFVKIVQLQRVRLLI